MHSTISQHPSLPAPTHEQRDNLNAIEIEGSIPDQLAHQFVELDVCKEAEGEFADLYRLQRDDTFVWLPHAHVAILAEHERHCRLVVTRELFEHVRPTLIEGVSS